MSAGEGGGRGPDSPASARGAILRLEIDSFKSYRGHNVVGPFKPFSVIIGPNGSGKSNIQDAISFVLGVRTAQLRGSLKELLYLNTEGQGPEDRPRRGGVKLVYEDAEGEEVHFERVIAPTSTGADTFASQYRLNGRAVTWDAYNRQLEGYNILVKARNFLVFQGDIENVAQMQPRDLTTLFEHISGSDQHRKQYEELEERKAAAEEKVALVFTRKKQIAQEKRQKKEQKEEAEKYMGLQRELEELKAQHHLWQVYHLEQDIAQARRDIAVEEAALAEAERSQGVSEREVEGRKRQQAGVAKERLLMEKKVKKKQGDADKQNPAAIQAREQIARLRKRIAAGERELEERRRKAADQRARVAALEAQLEALQDAQRALAEEEAAGRRGGLRLAPELLDEYNALKQEAGSRTAKTETERAALQTQQDADRQRLEVVQDDLRAMEERVAALEQQAAEAQGRHDATAVADADAKQQLQDKRRELEALESQRRRVEAARERLGLKLQDAEGALAEAKAERKESHREAAVADLLDRMRRSIPGVLGRLSELARPVDRKYNLAAAVVLGRDFDSVVVESEKVGIECVQHLKDQRAAPMTFLPIASLRVKPISEQLRQVRGARLAVDVIQPREGQEVIARVLQSVCGNTLVTDSVEAARQLAFDGPQRHKVVSLDGTLFNKAGIITGGTNQGMESRASRFDEAGAKQRMEKLKQDIAHHQSELGKLPTLRELTQAHQELYSAVTRLENQVSHADVDMKHHAGRVRECTDAAAALSREREARLPEAARLEEAIAERQRALDRMTRRINDIADRLFAAFSKKAGVASIREYEETHLRESQRLAEERRELAVKVSRAKNNLEYEQRSGDAAAAIGAKEAQLAEQRAQLEGLEAQLERHRAAAAVAAAEIEGLNAQLGELKGRYDALDVEVKELKKAAATHHSEVARRRRAIASRHAEVETLEARRKEMLETAAMEQVELPTLASPGGGGGAGRGSKRARSAEAEEAAAAEAAAEGMEVDGGEAGPSGRGAAQQAPRFDFSGLPRHALPTDEASRARTDREYRESIESIAGALAASAPNLKAVEQFEAVKEREREQLEELEAARKEAKAAAEAFHGVRQARYDAFTAAFEHVAAAIDGIYKELTRSAVHPVGGQAYLSLESADEPFLAGIKFTAMPPTKRFRDMEQLSGGEKTVAALALLFAVHSFQPSPFFVLDEVDAALDATNVVRVATYMRHMTRPATPGAFQGIVISLKDVFFEKADALVGVCRDQDRGCSATYTFDLSAFGEPLEAA